MEGQLRNDATRSLSTLSSFQLPVQLHSADPTPPSSWQSLLLVASHEGWNRIPGSRFLARGASVANLLIWEGKVSSWTGGSRGSTELLSVVGWGEGEGEL